MTLTCDNETSPRGAGHTTEGSNHVSDLMEAGALMADRSLPTVWTSKVARGAASELIASAHLMAQGYHVFRAVAANCPVDLVAYRDGELLRVEVKSASENPPYSPFFPAPSNDEWDLLVVVIANSIAVTLHFRPSIRDVKREYLVELERLGLLRTRRDLSEIGPLRYRRHGAVVHHLDGRQQVATTVCGLSAVTFLGASVTEQAHAASLSTCKSCARYVAEAERSAA